MRRARDRANDPGVPSLAGVVHRAVEVCDPDGTNDGLTQLLERFEDRDEPVTSIADVSTELAEAKGTVDPQDEDPAVIMAAALAVYLAYRRTELEREPDELLLLSARAEFDGDPPALVADWLAERGVEP